MSPRTASVLVAGRRVKVDGGTFSTQVDLTAGTNVVDVLAGSTHSPAAMAAVLDRPGGDDRGARRDG